MRDRGSVIIIEDEKVLLIKRIRENLIYFVFPGGGIENRETPEESAKREALEELGLKVKIKECISKVEFNGTQYFFRAQIVSGVLGTGSGDEYTEKNMDRGKYFPLWIDIKSLSSIDVRPKEVSLKILTLFNKKH